MKIQKNTKKVASLLKATSTDARKRAKEDASYTSWHTSSIGHVKPTAAKTNFHSYGGNKAIATTSYNALLQCTRINVYCIKFSHVSPIHFKNRMGPLPETLGETLVLEDARSESRKGIS